MELQRWFYNFPASGNCEKNHSSKFNIFKFNSNFLLLLINWATLCNQKHQCFRTYISYQKNHNAELSLQSDSLGSVLDILLCLQQDSRKTPLEKISFSKLFVFYCEFMHRFFLTFLTHTNLNKLALKGYYVRKLSGSSG